MEDSELIITRLVNTMFVHDSAGKRQIMRRRYSAAVIIPLDGLIRFSQNEHVVLSDAHHPVFVPAGADYLNECLEEAHSLLFNIDVAEHSDFIEPLPAADPADARTTFDRVSLMLETGAPVQCALSELYGLLGRMLTPGTPGEADRVLEPALALMMRDYANPELTASRLAEAARVSPAWLRRLFERQYGLTPFKYLTRLRMERAALLLREGRQVKDAALSVGYADIYQFSRAYKRHFGHAPTKEADD